MDFGVKNPIEIDFFGRFWDLPDFRDSGPDPDFGLQKVSGGVSE